MTQPPKPSPRVSASKYPDHPAPITGLGDLVALAAIPTAKALDKILGTDLEHCHSCHGPGGRQERLNAAVPFHRSRP